MVRDTGFMVVYTASVCAVELLIAASERQSGENGYYTYIYNPPAGYAWQVVALVGEEIAGGTGEVTHAGGRA